MKKTLSAAILALAALAATQAAPARDFVHPGLSYTTDDIEWMRQQIELKAEPAYSTFTALLASPYTAVTGAKPEAVTAIAEGRFNNTIGLDGRRIHDLALLYRLTDDTRYADEAVAWLNRYNGLTNASCRGTGPLDNGKIYLMLEGAELLRDYPGWSEADRKAFADMLVYPGYSDTRAPEEHYNINDAANNVSFYWNIYNFDSGRWGNQGLFAARGLMAMGIFLDNEKIYDRALRYLLALEARPDDIPYKTATPRRTSLKSSSDYLDDYNVSWSDGLYEYISDEALRYYIYSNGQCQESCRDQGHTMVGVGLYTDIAKMAGNQGYDLFGELDCRILLGLEHAIRYNLSPMLGEPWEPVAYSTRERDCSFSNSCFYRADSRSLRWSGKKQSPDGRDNAFNNVRYLAQAYAHYRSRSDIAPSRYAWLEKAYQTIIASGIEDGGAKGHLYEWKGWGTLTQRVPQTVPPESGLESAKAENASDTTEFFSISGMAVDSANAAPGQIYIVRRQGKTSKELISDRR